MKILLIDDSEIDLFINHKLIEVSALDTSIETFRNSVDALAYMQTHKDVSLLIIDNQMPGLSGLDLVTELRNVVKINTPIVVLTASIHPEDELKYKEIDPKILLLEKPLDVAKIMSHLLMG